MLVHGLCYFHKLIKKNYVCILKDIVHVLGYVGCEDGFPEAENIISK